jgi:hypothetical protein
LYSFCIKTSKLDETITIFVVVDLETVFHYIVCEFVYYLSPYKISHALLYWSLVIVMKWKAKENFHLAVHVVILHSTKILP